MKQVTQRARDGHIAVVDVTAPGLRPGWVLVENRYSLISAGTERDKVEVGEKMLQKARARPDLVVEAIEDVPRLLADVAQPPAPPERWDGNAAERLLDVLVRDVLSTEAATCAESAAR